MTAFATLAVVIALLPAAAELLGVGAYEALLFFMALLSAPLGVVAVLALLFAKQKRPWLRLAIACGALALAAYPCNKLALVARRLAFVRLASRSSELVSAIGSYERDHGTPPLSLDSLVPVYLERVPWTGMPAYPAYEYQNFPSDTPVQLHWYDLGSRNGKPFVGLWKYVDGESAHAILVLVTSRDQTVREVGLDRLPKTFAERPFDPEGWQRDPAARLAMVKDLVQTLEPEGKQLGDLASSLGQPDGQRTLLDAPWELSVRCPGGLLNWDVFFYWPGARYPDSSHGGSVERIGDWAYVHE